MEQRPLVYILLSWWRYQIAGHNAAHKAAHNTAHKAEHNAVHNAEHNAAHDAEHNAAHDSEHNAAHNPKQLYTYLGNSFMHSFIQ